MENDLIRRSAVINAIRGEREYLIARKQLNAEHVLAHHFDAIMDDIPAVDAVEVVHAYWKRVHDDVCYWSECSNCGGDMPLNKYRQEWESAVCPTCGARMDVRREDGRNGG